MSIYIQDEEENVLGYTRYKEELWEMIQSVNWKIIWSKERANGKRKSYIGTYSKKFGKYNKLHQLVI